MNTNLNYSAPAPDVLCSVCGKPVGDLYYLVNGYRICSDCGHRSVHDLYNEDIVELVNNVVAEVDATYAM